jgi:hypothetical protein
MKILLWITSSGSGQENRINDRVGPLRWPRDTHYPQKLALTSPTSGGRSVDIVRLRTNGHGVFFSLWLKIGITLQLLVNISISNFHKICVVVYGIHEKVNLYPNVKQTTSI